MKWHLPYTIAISTLIAVLWYYLVRWSLRMWFTEHRAAIPKPPPGADHIHPPHNYEGVQFYSDAEKEALIAKARMECIRCGKVVEQQHRQFAMLKGTGPFCDKCYDIRRSFTVSPVLYPDPLPEKDWAEWRQFTEDFDYEKKFYDVLLPTGEIVEQCWPNSGIMNEINQGRGKFRPQDNIKVRISHRHPMDD